MSSQPSIAISTINDGTMKRKGAEQSEVDENRRAFLAQHDSSLERSILVQLDYNSNNFCRYSVVDDTAAGEGMARDGRVADGLATTTKNLALFLPLADCNGVVLYDPEHEALMLTHLGRHNLEQNGGQRSVQFMNQSFGTHPEKLKAYFSPSAGREQYPLHGFEGKSIAEVSVEQLVAAGVRVENIQQSLINTTIDTNYFSHSEYLKGNRPNDGRFAVVAMLTN